MARSGGQKFSKEKFQGRIKDELNMFLRKEANDPRLTFVSITKVDLNKDYSVAKIYFDTFDANALESVKEAMGSTLSRMRKHLSTSLKVRHTPELKAFYDSQYEDELKITKILEADRDGEE
jgi:ribosome-binding factor A